MAGPPTSSDAMIILRWQGANQTYPGVTTLGVQAGTIDEDNLELLGDVLDAFTNQTFSSAIDDITATLKVGPVDLGPSFTIPVDGTGGVSGAPASPQTALLIRKGILNTSGRRWGRMFLPSPPETSVADRGLLTSGALSAYQSAANDLYASLVGLNFTPQVYREGISDPDVVDFLAVQPRVATQRRRLRR